MPRSIFRENRGFTYLAVLMAVVVMGIMLGAAGQTWSTAMKRERETELIFRGTQIRDAITRWYWRDPRKPGAVFPLNDLKDLLQDPRSLEKRKLLRRLYKDPMTGEEFEPLKDNSGRIIGVVSKSDEKPMKQHNFREDLKKDLDGKEKYSDWFFIGKQGLQPNAQPLGQPAGRTSTLNLPPP